MKNPIHDIDRSIVAEPVRRPILEIGTGGQTNSNNSKVNRIQYVDQLDVCGPSQAIL